MYLSQFDLHQHDHLKIHMYITIYVRLFAHRFHGDFVALPTRLADWLEIIKSQMVKKPS